MIVPTSRVGFGDNVTHIVQIDRLFSVKCTWSAASLNMMGGRQTQGETHALLRHTHQITMPPSRIDILACSSAVGYLHMRSELRVNPWGLVSFYFCKETLFCAVAIVTLPIINKPCFWIRVCYPSRICSYTTCYNKIILNWMFCVLISDRQGLNRIQKQDSWIPIIWLEEPWPLQLQHLDKNAFWAKDDLSFNRKYMCKQKPPWFYVDSYLHVLFVNEIFVCQNSLSHEKFLKIYCCEFSCRRGSLEHTPSQGSSRCLHPTTQTMTRLRHQMTEIRIQHTQVGTTTKLLLMWFPCLRTIFFDTDSSPPTYATYSRNNTKSAQERYNIKFLIQKNLLVFLWYLYCGWNFNVISILPE